MRTQVFTASDRIRCESARAALGSWLRSDQVNTRREGAAGFLVTGIASLVVLAGITILVIVAHSPLIGLIVWGVFGVFLLLFGVVMTWHGVDLVRQGRWLVHQFTDGFVMERTRGDVMPARYDEVDAVVMTYREPGDSTSPGIDHVLVQLTCADGRIWAMAEPLHGSVDVLRDLAAACRAGDSRSIEYGAAVELLAERAWG